jgi:nucleotide-binding universal stress UspA family protein
MSIPTAQSRDTNPRFVGDSHGARYSAQESTPLDDKPLPASAPVPAESARPARRIVVGIDGSTASIAALRRGVRMAISEGASLEAVTSWTFPTSYEAMAIPNYSALGDAEEILASAATEVFGQVLPTWFTTVAHEGRADQVLIKQSKGADMLIVGSRGHGGITGLLLGSVSAICAERASCPVLIMH